MIFNDNNNSQQFTRRVFIAVGVVFAAILLALAFYYAIDVILQLFAAVLLSIFLYGLSGFVSRRTSLSHGKSVLLVSLTLLVGLGLSVYLLAPSVSEQVKHLRDEMPSSAKKMSEFISQYGWGRTLIDQMPSAEEALDYVKNSSLLSRVGGVFSTTLGALANFFIVVLLAVYLAGEPALYVKGFIKLFPVERRARAREILYQIVDMLGWWLIGKFASMLAIGILTWIGLWLIGVPLSLTLGLIAGLLSFIPNFGPILSAVPAILLGFIESPEKALYVLILYIVVQLIESNLITPMIERRTVELPPALTIVAQLALGVLIGGLGLVLATPLLAVVMVLIQTVYIQDILGDRDVDVKEKDDAKEAAGDKVIEKNADLKENG